MGVSALAEVYFHCFTASTAALTRVVGGHLPLPTFFTCPSGLMTALIFTVPDRLSCLANAG